MLHDYFPTTIKYQMGLMGSEPGPPEKRQHWGAYTGHAGITWRYSCCEGFIPFSILVLSKFPIIFIIIASIKTSCFNMLSFFAVVFNSNLCFLKYLCVVCSAVSAETHFFEPDSPSYGDHDIHCVFLLTTYVSPLSTRFMAADLWIHTTALLKLWLSWWDPTHHCFILFPPAITSCQSFNANLISLCSICQRSCLWKGSV